MVYTPPPPPYQDYRQPPAYVYENNGRRQRQTSVENVTVPVVMIFAVVGISVAGAWWAGTQFTQINNSIDRLTDKLASIAGPINDRISRIERELTARTAARWTKADHVLWCSRTEQKNKGFKCADPVQLQGMTGAEMGEPPIWDNKENWDTTQK